jgi:hypothetical protein
VDGQARAPAGTVHGAVDAEGKGRRMPGWFRAMVTSSAA